MCVDRIKVFTAIICAISGGKYTVSIVYKKFFIAKIYTKTSFKADLKLLRRTLYSSSLRSIKDCI